MRKIKFRGLTANGEWVYGCLTFDLPHSTQYYDEYPNRIHWQAGKFQHNQPVRKGTEGQYIGTRDKNKQEVYEGDLYQQKGMGDELIIGTIVFYDDHSFRCREGKYIYHWVKFTGEVIGNIHEGPEPEEGGNNESGPYIKNQP